MTFVHLATRSNFSFLDGGSTLDELADAALAVGSPILAIADRNNVCCLPELLNVCERKSLEPAIGADVDGGGSRALLYPRDGAGWSSLCRAITARHRIGPELDLRGQLARDSRGLTVISDDTELLKVIVDARGRDDVFLELRSRRPALEREAARLGIATIATHDVRFARPEHRARHRVLRAIANLTTLGRLDERELAREDAWLGPAPSFDHGATARAGDVARACRFGGRAWGFGLLKFPRWEDASGKPAHEVLRALVLDGARWRYRVPDDEPLPDRVRRRIELELDLVERKGFADYFLVVREIVRQAPRTCGRGSAAASAIAYCLGITHVDPVRHDLFFERFLNEGREEPPDIDVDFPWDERDRVLEWVFARWGARAAMVANHVRFRPRAALRETAKSYGLPEEDVARVTARIPWFAHDEDLEAMTREHPLLRRVELDPPWDEIVPIAQSICGFPRHMGLHPGGVVIVPDEIASHVPVETSAKGLPVIQWEKDGTEDSGLVKIDILGNRSLAVIRDALAAASSHGHAVPAFAELDPEDDGRVQAMLARGETFGCFYVESPAMRQLQRKCGRGDFERLVVHSSIIRPAANEFIREYIRRIRGGTWVPLHPVFEEILEESFGVMSYQEDVARIAIALSGFTATEADRLRKILSKKDRAHRLADQRARFVDGGRSRGIPDDVLETCWKMMLSFAGYSFCKAHSASYAKVSFKCAWLRDRFPAEFIAGVISNGGGYYSTLGYVSEARRLNLAVLPPCVNASAVAWTGHDRAIRVGLGQVKGLRASAAKAIVAERARGPYRDVLDLAARVPALHDDELRSLVKAGALDAPGAGVNSPQANSPHAAALPRWNRAQQLWAVALRKANAPAGRLFEAASRDAPPRLTPPEVPDHDARAKLKHEVEALGLPVSCHPLDLWEPALSRVDRVDARDLERHRDRRVRVVGWQVTGKVVSAKTGDPMEFVTLEDRTALIETVFFPRAYDRYVPVLFAPRPVIAEGRVQVEHDVAALVVEKARGFDGPSLIDDEALLDSPRREDLESP